MKAKVKYFSFWNNLTGWVVFALALLVYWSTIEPTTSLWDTGEFIAAAYKLQVVHPPGAPIFLMINRLTSLLAPSPEWVAPMVNGTSALASAFTILFLCWTISGLGYRLLEQKNDMAKPKIWVPLLGSSFLGSLIFTFSDTFWFSATEGEVYALSAFFMAFIFWLMLKWEKKAGEKGHLRYIILIAYLIGLSLGVHLLSLLVIPALALVYYFKQYPFSWRGLGLAILTGLLILIMVNFGLIRWFPSIAAAIEVFMVNQMGFPFWSGILFSMLLLAGLLIWGAYQAYLKKKVARHTVLLSLIVILIGYSSYSMVVIRSKADPSIDMNNPETVFNLKSYLNREQYGDRPLIYGPYFDASIKEMQKGSKQYQKGGNKYEALGHSQNPIFKPEDKMLFPRMVDRTRQDRKAFYRKWGDLKKGEVPTFADNLHFFLTYQVGHMWWRYFGWNFIGRQNDLKGTDHSFFKGNWLTGWDFFDQTFLNIRSSEALPQKFQDNPGRNFLFGLPFILGILGLWYQFRQDPKRATTVLVFFLITGIGLIIYLNNPPLEPRERDYTLVGSFYAFAIWVGIGVLGLLHLISRNRQWSILFTLPALVILLTIPAIMANAGWDDHDRSGRYFARNLAYNYLNSCDSNAVLFTSGDNETYPLWYIQEVEGIRKDVRVVNKSLLGTDWYHKQLRKPAHGAEGLNFSTSTEKLRANQMQNILYRQHPKMDQKKHYDLNRIIQFIASDEKATKLTNQGGGYQDFLPTQKLSIPVDKRKVLKNGTVKPANTRRIVNPVKFQYPKNYLSKSDFLTLDFIAQNQWERPVYFTISAGKGTYAGLSNFFRMDGLAYRLVPVPDRKNLDQQPGWVNPSITYNNVMKAFKWGNLDDPSIYLDNVMRTQSQNYRNVFNRLATYLSSRNQNQKGVQVLDKAREVMSRDNVPYGYNTFYMVERYYALNAPEKGKKLAKAVKDAFSQELNYFLSQPQSFQKQVENRIETKLYCLNQMRKLANRHQQKQFTQQLSKAYNRFQNQYQ